MEKYTDEIQSVKKKIRQLKNRQKVLLKKQSDVERKARTRRLIERGAILESLFPDVVPMTNEQVKAFLEKLRRPNVGTK